jgi:hypothetical protein
MLNYLVWRDHGEVEPPAIGVESDGNEDEDWMDEMITDIGREYEVGFGEQAPPLEVQNFYRLLTTSDWESARWHWCDRTVSGDMSNGDEIEVQLLKSML